MEHILEYQFFQNALYAAVISSIVCGIIGAYIVVRRIVFISGGITHASFGGLGFGLFIGVNPILTAGIISVCSALGIGLLNRKAQMREDAAIASIWALGMALGVLFMTLTPGYTTGLSSYLFGNILLVGYPDLVALTVLSMLLIGLFTFAYRPILYSIFDADFATTRGLSAFSWNLLMLVFVAISMVLCIRIVGIMLLMALLTIPQSIASLYTDSFRRIILSSIGISLLINTLGIVLSIYLDNIPTGVVIVLLLFVALALASLLRMLLSSKMRQKMI